MRHGILRTIGLGVLLLSLIAPPAAASSRAPLAPVQVAGAPATMPAQPSAQKPLPPPADKHSVLGETDPGGDQPATYIVQLSSPPLASCAGAKPGLAPTTPRMRGEDRLNLASAASASYMSFLAVEQAAAQVAIEQALGRPVEVKFTYAVAYNGLAIVVSPQEAVTVAGLPGVVRVERDALQQLHTDAGPTWIGADEIWLTPAPGFPNGYKGEGVVVGVIDTGINFASLSFAGIGADQYVIQNPRGRYYGVCDPANPKYDATFVCNSKLIGTWDFADGSEPSDGPRDNDGHGSHTASTAAGNYVWLATGQAPTLVINADISGVAPHANLIAYDACGLVSCATSALIAAINQATADGVDVINYSIGGSSADPWQRSDALAMLGALDAGVAVAVSAGNSGPGAATVGSPANAPWVTAVGASTHDRTYVTGLSALAGGATPPPGDIYGVAVTAGMAAPAPIIYAGSASLGALADPQCTREFPAGSLAGKIVVCDPGTVGRGAKGYNVLAGGAAGVVLIAAASSGDTLSVDAHALPAAYIRAADGERLKNWLAAGAGHTAMINGVQADYAAANADHVVGFSSRGPDATVPDVLKPDVTAPGVGIYAAFKLPEQYAVINGTSMASPHTAGALALLAGLHPTWTPAELKAALMLAANPVLTKETWANPADPFDKGAGRIDLPGAAGVGFVLDENAYNFQQADPALGGDPTTRNLPSLANQACVGICTWTRTLKNVDGVAKTYNVAAARRSA